MGPRAARRRRWLRAAAPTLVLTALVISTIEPDWRVSLVLFAVFGGGFGFFSLVFPDGVTFGRTAVNLLAIYACLFNYFVAVAFPLARSAASLTGFCLPVGGFLLGCLLNRARVGRLIRARQNDKLLSLPRVGGWLPWMVAIGVLALLSRRFSLDGEGQGVGLLVCQGAAAAVMAWRACDAVLLATDIAMVFASVSGRLNRLVIPVMAFLTYYMLLVVVFACLYRLTEIGIDGSSFLVHGQGRELAFPEALYFSVTTLATVGYGDIVPVGPLVRALAVVEVVSGQLLLLFGVSEIMHSDNSGPDRRPPRRPVPPSEP